MQGFLSGQSDGIVALLALARALRDGSEPRPAVRLDWVLETTEIARPDYALDFRVARPEPVSATGGLIRADAAEDAPGGLAALAARGRLFDAGSETAAPAGAGAPAVGRLEAAPGSNASALLDDLVRRADPEAAGASEATLALPEDPLPPAFAPGDFTGAGELIVVIDDGYSPFYDQSATVLGYDFFGFDDPDASVAKLDSHGSWVAQTALGIAPEADIVHFKVFPDDDGNALIRDIEEALDATIALAADVEIAAVNLSLGFGNATQAALTPLSDEFAALAELGIASVAAAGNDGAANPDGVSIIAADPNVIAVSASDAGGRRAGFSQADAALTDIFAPGVDVPVETVDGLTGTVSGTSFAAPAVSGAIARLQEASETVLGGRLAPEAALEILQLSGDPLVGAPEPAPEGYRVADAEDALAFFLEDPEAWSDFLV